MNTKEEWRSIKGYEGKYEVSSFGRVKSLSRFKCLLHGKEKNTHEKILKFDQHKNGYLFVHLYNNGSKRAYSVHRLVAEAFIPNTRSLPQINHIDGDKTNNNTDNIEWCTAKENNLHSARVLHLECGVAIKQFDENGFFIKEYANTGIASEETGVNRSSICSCLIGRQKHAGGFLWVRS